MDFANYKMDPSIFDEMFLPDGEPREGSRLLHEALTQLSQEELSGIQERVTHSFSTEGITFTVYGDEEAEERIIPVDFIPRIISASEWDFLERGLVQRVTTLNLFLSDVYGEGRITSDGVIPVDVVRGCPQYCVEMRGMEPPLGVWVAICGTDLVRTNDGFFVLEDNLRVPSGVSYMIANRKAVKAGLRRVYRGARVRDVDHYGRLLHQTLRELAPRGQPDPSVVLLTPGIYNSAFYEHMFLAGELGAQLVEGRDLLVFQTDSLLGVPGLMHAYRLGNVTLANAPGTGVADDKSVYAYVPDMVRYYLGEEPLLQNVKTHLCRRPEGLEYTLDNLDKLVVKRVGGSGGYGMLVGPHASQAERAAYAREIQADPTDFISQPTLALSQAPCLIDGRFEPRHVDLRPFMLSGRETRTVPGGLCRVALRKGSLVVNSSQGGGKDLWVLED